MKQVIIAGLVSLACVAAQAKTFYIVNGKAATAAQAKKADKNATIIKVQASKVQMNEDTGNLKKSADVEATDLKKAVSAL